MSLELAQLTGADASGSVGRPSKVAYLRSHGVVFVASSRDAATFVRGAASCLTGMRLHAVLSALSKSFIPASLTLLNDLSCYLEVGKNNIWSESRMAAAAPISPFRLVAADYQSAEWTKTRLSELTVRVSAGMVHPLPLSVFRFETAEMIRAFNELRRGEQIGRYVAMIAASPSVAAGGLGLSAGSLSSPTQTPGVLAVGYQYKQRQPRHGDAGTLVQLFANGTTITVQLSDPEHFNTFSSGLGEDMSRVVQHLHTLPGVSSVTLQSAGPHFSVGGNPYTFHGTAAQPPAVLANHLIELYEGFLLLRTLPHPVTCAVHGSLVGGGIAGCLHADYIAADSASTFEHGNLVRGVCVLGMLSQTFYVALGPTSQHIYLQNARLEATAALALGLIHRVCAGVATAKRHAHEVARLAAKSDDLVMAVCCSRVPIDPDIVRREAVGHAECRLHNGGGFAKSTIPSHACPLDGHLDMRPVRPLPRQANAVCRGWLGDVLSAEKARLLSLTSVGCAAELAMESRRLCDVDQLLLVRQPDDCQARDVLPAALEFDQSRGVARIILEARCSSHRLSSSLHCAIRLLASIGPALRAIALRIHVATAAYVGSTRAWERMSVAIEELHALGVPIICSADGEIGAFSLAICSSADYLIAGRHTKVRTVDRQMGVLEAQHLGLISETTDDLAAADERAMHFAAWLAHHPALGLKHMLALTRPRVNVQCAHSARAVARLALLHPIGTRAENRLHIAQSSAQVEAVEPTTRSARPRRSTSARNALASLRPAACVRRRLAGGPCTRAASVHGLEIYEPRHCVSASALDALNGRIDSTLRFIGKA